MRLTVPGTLYVGRGLRAWSEAEQGVVGFFCPSFSFWVFLSGRRLWSIGAFAVFFFFSSSSFLFYFLFYFLFIFFLFLFYSYFLSSFIFLFFFFFFSGVDVFKCSSVSTQLETPLRVSG